MSDDDLATCHVYFSIIVANLHLLALSSCLRNCVAADTKWFSQPAGTELIMQDVDVSGQHRFWVSKATFLRVNFHDNSGWTGGQGTVSSPPFDGSRL